MKHIKIGREITEVINRLGLSKSEFGRRVGVQQQNVNRLLECHYMATNKLEDICEALDYNFFRLWVDDEPTTIKAESSEVSLDTFIRYIAGNDLCIYFAEKSPNRQRPHDFEDLERKMGENDPKL